LGGPDAHFRTRLGGEAPPEARARLLIGVEVLLSDAVGHDVEGELAFVRVEAAYGVPAQVRPDLFGHRGDGGAQIFAAWVLREVQWRAGLWHEQPEELIRAGELVRRKGGRV